MFEKANHGQWSHTKYWEERRHLDSEINQINFPLRPKILSRSHWKEELSEPSAPELDRENMFYKRATSTRDQNNKCSVPRHAGMKKIPIISCLLLQVLYEKVIRWFFLFFKTGRYINAN